MNLRKNILYLVFALVFFSFITEKASALSFDYFALERGGSVIDMDAKEEENCMAIFGNPDTPGDFANYLQQIFNVFKYLAPTLVIVLTIMDFIKVVASQDKDALVKAGKKAGMRLILAIVLFFIPNLINFFFHLIGFYGTCGIG